MDESGHPPAVEHLRHLVDEGSAEAASTCLARYRTAAVEGRKAAVQ